MAAAGALLAAMSSCSLALDFGESSTDASAPPTILCAAGETNNLPASPYDLTPPATFQAAVCPEADKDFYRISVPADTTITIDLVFAHSDGDLALGLVTEALPTTYVASSNTQDDAEHIVYSAPMSGNYLIEVYGNENTYSLSVMLTPGAATLQR